MAVQQNNDFKQLLHFESGPSYPKDFRAVNAAVLAFPSGAFTEQIVIGAGTSSGVHLNTPVVSADGLVGKVTQAGHSTSVVTLLPLSNATTPSTMTAGASQTLYGWRCGASGDGTTVSPKYLPGSCRG